MRKLIRTTSLIAVLLAGAAPLFAATAVDFYLTLLRRGVSDFDGGRFEKAADELRIAAFGLIDVPDQYETALAYLAVAYDRENDADHAIDAARRLVAAERVTPRLAALQLPPAVRDSFLQLARRGLSPADLATLSGTARTAASTTTAVPPTPPPAQQTVATYSVPASEIKVAPPQPAAPAPKSIDVPAAPVENKPAAVRQPAAAPPPSTPAPRPSTTTQRQTVPSTAPATSSSRLAPADVAARIAAADKAADEARLNDARQMYRDVLAQPSLDRTTVLRVAEGLYRSRDFAGTLDAFRRLGPLQAGEEPYGYYVAVALYETGDYAGAKKALTAALPYIEVTTDVARYRARIDAAVN